MGGGALGDASGSSKSAAKHIERTLTCTYSSDLGGAGSCRCGKERLPRVHKSALVAALKGVASVLNKDELRPGVDIVPRCVPAASRLAVVGRRSVGGEGSKTRRRR